MYVVIVKEAVGQVIYIVERSNGFSQFFVKAVTYFLGADVIWQEYR